MSNVLPNETTPPPRDSGCKFQLDEVHESSLNLSLERKIYPAHGLNKGTFPCRLVPYDGDLGHFAQDCFRATLSEPIDCLIEETGILPVRAIRETRSRFHLQVQLRGNFLKRKKRGSYLFKAHAKTLSDEEEASPDNSVARMMQQDDQVQERGLGLKFIRTPSSRALAPRLDLRL